MTNIHIGGNSKMLPASRTRRLIGGVIAAVLVAVSLAACGSSSASPNSLRMLTFDGPSQAKLIRQQLAVFTKKTGIAVTLQTLPGGSAAVYPGQVRTQILGGNAPDVFEIWGGQLAAPFVKAGLVVPLGKYYKKYNWGAAIASSYVAGLTYNGIKYGVPLYTGNLTAWYNKEMFSKAGISSPPTTYKELEADNEKLVAAGDVPADLGGMYGWDLQRLFEYLLEVSAGPELHDQLLAGKASWDQPAVVEAFSLLRRWQTMGWLPKGVMGIDPTNEGAGYVAGKEAYTIAGSWMEPVIDLTPKSDHGKFGVFDLPTDHTPNRHAGFVQGYMITSASQEKGNAAALINFMAQPKVQIAIQNTLSTVKGAQANPATQPLSAENNKIGATEPFYLVQDQALPQNISNDFYQVQSNVIQGVITPQKAAQEMQQYISTWAKSK